MSDWRSTGNMPPHGGSDLYDVQCGELPPSKETAITQAMVSAGVEVLLECVSDAPEEIVRRIFLAMSRSN